MVFEFLTGGLPLGFAIVLGALPLAISHDSTSILKTTTQCFLAFCVAAVTCLGFKLVLAMATFGSGVINDFLGALSRRMSLAHTPDPNGGPILLAAKIIGGLNSLSGNMRLLSGLTIVIAGTAGLWGFAQIQRLAASDRLKTQSTLMLTSNAPIVLWLVVFWQHSIQHAWFMDRILVWEIGSGFSLFAVGALCNVRFVPVMSDLPKQRSSS